LKGVGLGETLLVAAVHASLLALDPLNIPSVMHLIKLPGKRRIQPNHHAALSMKNSAAGSVDSP
jgi:hypothetical protein